MGALGDTAEDLGRIVEDAMRDRRMQAWQPSPDDFGALESMAAETGRTLDELLNEALRLLLQQWRRNEAGEKHPTTSNSAAGKPIWQRIREVAAEIPEEVGE